MWDIKRMSSLIKPDNYYPLLIFQAVSHATRKSKYIKKDFMFLGKMLRGLGAQVVFSSILPGSILRNLPNWRLESEKKGEWIS